MTSETFYALSYSQNWRHDAVTQSGLYFSNPPNQLLENLSMKQIELKETVIEWRRASPEH